MTNEEAIRRLENISSHAVHTIEEESFIMSIDDGIAIKMAIKALETVQRIDDVLNVEGMTEIDVLDEIMDAVSEFKYDCGVDE